MAEAVLSSKKIQSQRLVMLLAVLVLLTFGRICAHGFSNWDDSLTMSQNRDFNPPTLKGTLHYWWTKHLSLYIPVTYMVWGSLAAISGLGATRTVTPNPWIFHSASVLIHLSSVLIVFGILKRLCRNDIAAALGATVFAVHPVQVEAVAWASGMKDLLCGMFSLLAILLYVRWAQEKKGAGSYFLATLALVAALLSKPTAMITPLLVLIVDHWLLDRSWRESFKSLWLWFILIIPIAIIARMVQGTEGTPLTPWWTRPLIYTDAMAFYLGKIFLPIRLVPDYARSPVYAMQRHWIYWTWIFPAIAAALILIFRRRRWLVGGALLFLAGWLPVSGLTGFLFQYYSTVADHYLYLPMFGVAVVVAYFAASHAWVENPLLAIIAILALLSFNQAGYWGTDTRLYQHVLAVSPRSYMAYVNLANVNLLQNNPDKAEALLRRGTKVDPDYYQAWETLTELLAQRGKMDEAIDAEKHAMIARGFLPSHGGINYAEQIDMFGELLMKRGRYREAIEQFDHALEVNPEFAPAREHLLEAQKHLQSKPTMQGS